MEATGGFEPPNGGFAILRRYVQNSRESLDYDGAYVRLLSPLFRCVAVKVAVNSLRPSPPQLHRPPGEVRQATHVRIESGLRRPMNVRPSLLRPLEQPLD